MSVVSLNYAPMAAEKKSRPSILARIFDALYRGRMAQAERVIREHRHLLDASTSVTQPSSEMRCTR